MHLDVTSNDFVLLITGCVDAPVNQRYHTIIDVNERWKQYRKSIVWFIKNTPIHCIVFCENSGFFEEREKERERLCELAEEYGKLYECLSFRGNGEMVIKINKGYGEGEIIEYALNNSEILKNAATFCKVTGRVKVRNIDSVLYKMEYGGNYFNRGIQHGRHSIDTRLYCCDIAFYRRNLQDIYKRLIMCQSIEGEFWNVLKERKREWRSTFSYPDYDGLCGGSGKPYNINRLLITLLSLACRMNMYNCFALPLYTAYRKIQLRITGKN